MLSTMAPPLSAIFVILLFSVCAIVTIYNRQLFTRAVVRAGPGLWHVMEMVMGNPSFQPVDRRPIGGFPIKAFAPLTGPMVLNLNHGAPMSQWCSPELTTPICSHSPPVAGGYHQHNTLPTTPLPSPSRIPLRWRLRVVPRNPGRGHPPGVAHIQRQRPGRADMLVHVAREPHFRGLPE